MNDPIIILWPYKKSKKKLHDFVKKCICFFTNSDYTHVAVYLDGKTYESTVMNNQHGVLYHYGLPGERTPEYVYLAFKEKFKNSNALKYVMHRKAVQKQPYNFFKLIVLAFVYPTRKFWNWIKWVPFDKECFGSVCSEFVDESFKEIGIDLLPSKHEGYTSPGDFLKSELLMPVEKKDIE